MPVQRTPNDLNGLHVGDVIYNKYRDGMFIIQQFEFERILTNPSVPHPYILARQITFDERGIKYSVDDVKVSLHGSQLLTRERVHQMIVDHTEQASAKLDALRELASMTD
jgi:hypothetical protein